MSKQDKSTVDWQLFNVGLLVISITSAHAGTLSKEDLAHRKHLLLGSKEIYLKGQSTEQKFHLNLIKSLWGEEYVHKAVAYARKISKQATGEDVAEKIFLQSKPTFAEINEPKEKLFGRSHSELTNEKKELE